MTTRITAPVSGLNGPGVGGLIFENSVAETDNQAIIDYCQAQGYTVEDSDETPATPASLDDLTAEQLDELAAFEEIDLTGCKKSKATRVEAITASRQEKAEREAYALDHTWVVTVKNTDGDEIVSDIVAEDEEQVTSDLSFTDVEIISIEKKLTGEPTEQV